MGGLTHASTSLVEGVRERLELEESTSRIRGAAHTDHILQSSRRRKGEP